MFGQFQQNAQSVRMSQPVYPALSTHSKHQNTGKQSDEVVKVPVLKNICLQLPF